MTIRNLIADRLAENSDRWALAGHRAPRLLQQRTTAKSRRTSSLTSHLAVEPRSGSTGECSRVRRSSSSEISLFGRPPMHRNDPLQQPGSAEHVLKQNPATSLQTLHLVHSCCKTATSSPSTRHSPRISGRTARRSTQRRHSGEGLPEPVRLPLVPRPLPGSSQQGRRRRQPRVAQRTGSQLLPGDPGSNRSWAAASRRRHIDKTNRRCRRRSSRR